MAGNNQNQGGAKNQGGANKPPEQQGGADTQPEVVAIPKAQLEALLTGFEKAQESIKTLTERDEKREEEITKLLAIADKARLSHYETNENKDAVLITKAKVGFFNGEPIIAWQKVKDEVGFRNGRLEVNQIIRVFTDVGEKEPKQTETEYLYWAQNTTTQEGEVVSKTETNGAMYWTVELKDGRKITLDIRFINPF